MRERENHGKPRQRRTFIKGVRAPANLASL